MPDTLRIYLINELNEEVSYQAKSMNTKTKRKPGANDKGEVKKRGFLEVYYGP